MIIRPIEAHELPALHALVESAFRGDSARRGWTHEADLLGGQRTDMAALQASFEDPAQRILVADDGGELAGSITVIDKGDGAAGLSMLSVDPARQAAGLGSRLIDAAEAYAATHFDARSIHMTVIKQRPALIDYYVRRGYRLTGVEEPFPNDERFGLPVTRDLVFVALVKAA